MKCDFSRGDEIEMKAAATRVALIGIDSIRCCHATALFVERREWIHVKNSIGMMANRPL
ncbi:hypothetical protein GCM10022394_11550 [Zobellella aerophila]|uniref:Uncharacterized protein n=1 Tax=Zobellella aerophila TaxID=870480 RepID=A0ABP6VDH3_9GAMM